MHRVDARDQCLSTRVIEHGKCRCQHVVGDLLRPIERCALLISGRGDVLGPAEGLHIVRAFDLMGHHTRQTHRRDSDEVHRPAEFA